MRPVSKGNPRKYADGQPYENAREDLIQRLGSYCSYCERYIPASLAVEHIQPKSKPPYHERIWSNFLLACASCNGSKSTHDPDLETWLIPDRDNTFAAFIYQEDGIIALHPTLSPSVAAMAKTTLDLLGLNRIDSFASRQRRDQSLEEWGTAIHFRLIWDSLPSLDKEMFIVKRALAKGFFSIWMAAFADAPEIRRALIRAFPGTEAGCFDPITTQPLTPHPNPDGLSCGGKA